MRIKSGHDCLGAKCAALGQLNSGGASILHENVGHLGCVQYLSSVAGYLSHHGTGKFMRSAIAVTLVTASLQHKSYEHAYSCFSGVQSPHATGVQQEGSDSVILEVTGDDVQWALFRQLQHFLADFGFLHGHGDIQRRHRWNVRCRSQYVIHNLAP